MMARDGIAALFDALVFLAIASVVSVALLSAFSGTDPGPEGGLQSRVEAAHLVLLRSSVKDGDGNAHSLEALCKLNSELGTEHREHIEDIMDLLLSGLGWRWTVQCGDTGTDLGSTAVPGPGEPVYCSLVRAPIGDEAVVFRLEAWSL
jgi:hypothetical protein